MKVPVLLLSLLLAAPVIHVQAATATGTPLLTDKAGDVKIIANGNDLGNPASLFGSFDLKGVSLEEQDDALVVRFEVASLSADGQANALEGGALDLTFRFADQVYRVTSFHGGNLIGSSAYFSFLSVFDPSLKRFLNVGDLVTVVEGDTMLAISVPRDSMATKQGDAPAPGHVLTGFHASAHALNVNFNARGGGPVPIPSFTVQDLMPETGNGTVDFPIKLGVQQTGAIRLDSDLRFRASNGGTSDTLVYQVNVHNLEMTAHRVHLQVVGIPAGWKVSLPSRYVELEANATVALPVLLQTPSGHTHGTTQKFLVEAHSETDGSSVGRIELGLRFTEPPQPAGHHDTVYFHTRTTFTDQTSQALGTALGSDGVETYMNARLPKNEPADAAVPAYGFQSGSDLGADPAAPGTAGPRQTWQWRIDLSPSLLLGLDVDLTRTGTITVPVGATVLPLVSAQLDGTLIHYDGDGSQPDFIGAGPFNRPSGTPTTVGTLHADIGTINPQASQVVETQFVPDPAADYIQFMPGSSLVLYVNVTSTFLPFFGFGPYIGPVLLPGGSLQIPLLEYHDPVADIFASASALTFLAQGPQDRLANPGTAVLFNMTLVNDGDVEGDIRLNVTGENAAWSKILTATEFKVPPGGNVRVPVAVMVPDGATQGQTADLLVQAVDTADPTMQSLAHLFVTVDLESQHPSDSAAVAELQGGLQGEKKTPGLELAILGLAILVLAIRRRRA